MQKKLLLDHQLFEITIQRLCQQLIENHDNFDSTVIIGLQPRGIFLANRIKDTLESLPSATMMPIGAEITSVIMKTFRVTVKPSINAGINSKI